MIPNIPNVNKLSFSSSGGDGEKETYFLDKFPALDGGFIATTIVLKKSLLGRKLLKARREADNVEVDVYPYKIKAGLAGLHPNSLTSNGQTIEEFANGGAVRCVRIYNSLDGEFGGTDSAESDASALFSSAQPRIVDSSGNFKSVGVAYGADFADPSASGYSLQGFGKRITQQRQFSLFPVQDLAVSGSYYAGVFGGSNSWYVGEVGNFGAQATTAFYGSYISQAPKIAAGESAVQGFYIDGANSRIHRNGATHDTGDAGDRFSSELTTIQYGDYYVSSGVGTLLGPIFINLKNYEIDEDRANEMTKFLQDLLEIDDL